MGEDTLKLVWRRGRWVPDMLADRALLVYFTGKSSVTMEEYDSVLLPAIAGRYAVQTIGYPS